MRPSRKPLQMIQDQERLQAGLRKASVGFLGMVGADGPYVVPVNFVLAGERIYIHSALEGAKIEALRRDPRICLAAVPHAEYLEGQGNYSYESILVFGRASLLEDREDKRRAYLRIIGRYDPGIADMLTEACIEGSAILAIDIERISGKKGSQDA